MDEFGKLEYLAQRLQQLANREVRPSKIIGTGYKNPRDEAFLYLANRIMDEISTLKGEPSPEYDSDYFRELRLTL